MRNKIGLLATVALAAFGASTALAQQATDYVISQYAAGSKYEAPPAGATTLTMPSNDDSGVSVSLPFSFTFFGSNYTACTVDTNGWLSFVIGTSSSNYYTNSAFPLVSGDNSAAMIGTVCPYWDDLYLHAGTGSIKTWTSGSTPNRHFVVSWESVTNYPDNTTSAFTFQVQLYETSNSIVFSYVPGSTWYASSSYTAGIEAADGSRYQYPSAIGNDPSVNSGQPPYDFSFDLPSVVFTGRVFYDRYVVDESGIGNTSQQNIPLTGFRVEARNSANVAVGFGTTDGNGNFSVEAKGVPPATIGSLVVCSQNAVCSVRATSGGALYSATLNNALPFTTDRALGDLLLHEGVDPGGVGRAPLNIARTVQTVYDWAHARSTDSIPVLEILYSTSSALPTSYTAKVGATPASMRVSGASSNPDPWDVSVIRKTYGRHVLGAICADPTSTYTTTFDAVSNSTNAFAEGFGYYINAVVSGDRKYYDGINATTTNVIDLEDANPTSRKGDDVTAWVAEALYDLTDPANEPWDTFAGAGAPGAQVFQIVDSLSVPPTASKFFDAWLAAGFDGPALSQNFIHHGLLPDDGDEPNDDFASATPISTFGFLKDGRVLNLFNEDWYKFTLSEPTASLTASVSYDRSKYASANVALELRSAADSLLAVGSAADATSPIALTTSSVPAGDYVLRVALTSGGPVPQYSVQAFSQLAFKAAAFQPWTVGRPYDVPLTITGGIPPYILTVPSNYVAPTGLALDGANGRVTGTPAGPPGGVPVNGRYKYDFLLKAQDSARPPNLAQNLMSFTLNDIVRSRFAEFVAFAKDKALDRAWPNVGGTAPYVVSVESGALPDGITAKDGADLRFAGAAVSPGSNAFRINVTDVAGSSATTLATAVVCVPPGPADLAAGKSACGYYVDAVKGASIGLSIATAKKRPVRALRTAMFDVDGTRALTVVPKIAKGKISFAKFIAPASGRFYFVIASDDDLDATQFTCAAKTAAPTSAKGVSESTAFGGDDQFEASVGVLAGGTLTMTVKADKKSGLHVKVLALKDPTGADVQLAATDVKAKGVVLTLTKKVDVSGTWTVVLGAEAGPRGAFTYAFKLKQPKGVLYSAD
jgi:hypothetical protein